MDNAGRRHIHAQAACREAGLYGAATDCASPTRGSIGENSWRVPANGAKTDAIGIERRRDRTGRAQRRVVEMDVAVGTQRPRPGSAQLPRRGRCRPFDGLTLPAPRPAMSMRQPCLKVTRSPPLEPPLPDSVASPPFRPFWYVAFENCSRQHLPLRQGPAGPARRGRGDLTWAQQRWRASIRYGRFSP